MKGIKSTQVAKIIDTPFKTLDRWLREGLIACTQHAQGTGSRRLWTRDDVVRAAIIAGLRKHGMSTYRIRRLRKASPPFKVALERMPLDFVWLHKDTVYTASRQALPHFFNKDGQTLPIVHLVDYEAIDTAFASLPLYPIEEDENTSKA